MISGRDADNWPSTPCTADAEASGSIRLERLRVKRVRNSLLKYKKLGDVP
jgi:hypothetical protein